MTFAEGLRILFDEKWRELVREVMPPEATDLEIATLKAAFYAGGSALIYISLTPMRAPTPGDLKELSRSLSTEIGAIHSAYAKRITL